MPVVFAAYECDIVVNTLLLLEWMNQFPAVVEKLTYLASRSENRTRKRFADDKATAN